MSPSPENNSKPTGNLIHLPNTYWLMWLENVQKGPKNDQKHPKNVENQANWPKNIQKVHKLLQKFYSQQKARELPSKSYCWSSNLLGTSCLGAATISSSAVPNKTYHTKLTQPSKHTKPSLWNLTYQTKPTKPNLPSQTFKNKYINNNPAQTNEFLLSKQW